MIRTVFAVLALSLLAPNLDAQEKEWATKMFNTRSHDFGTVARGSKQQYAFQVKNLYEEDVHIVGVLSSCNCTTPKVAKSDLKTFETTEIIAEFNTRDFPGSRQATITVSFDKPYPAKVQLNITGHVRTDVVLQPGAIDLGVVDQGTEVEKRVMVNYAGRDNWKIVKARTPNDNLGLKLVEIGRGGGKVSYELIVRLSKDAPVGYVKDQVFLVTNDPKAQELPVDVEGHVAPELSISPSSLFMGVVQPGQKVTQQLVVRSKKPFKILDIKCDDKSFEIEKSTAVAKKVHLVPVVFTGGDKPGKIKRQIAIETDQGEGASAVVTAFAQVVSTSGARKKSKGPASDDAPPESADPGESQ